MRPSQSLVVSFSHLTVSKRTEPEFDEESPVSKVIALFEQAAKEHPTLFVKRNWTDEWKVESKGDTTSPNQFQANKLLDVNTIESKDFVARDEGQIGPAIK